MGGGVFAGLPDPVRGDPLPLADRAARVAAGLPGGHAWTEEGEIMGLRHREHPVHGVQFHPESILTGEGKKLLKNFLEL